MRAVYYEAMGPAREVLRLGEIETPEPGAGEVRVRLATSGVNPSDVKSRGLRKIAFPRVIPHSDGAGEIDAVGEGVAASRIGERVWLWNGQWRRPSGTAAEFIVVPEAQAVPLPAGSPTVPHNRPRHYWPGSKWVDWAGTDFYASYPEWGALTGLYNRYAKKKPFALTEWGVEAGDDPAFVSKLFAWVGKHPRTKMLVYYQDFGSTSNYRIQNYSASLAVLKDRLHSGLFPSFAPDAPELPPPPQGGIGTPRSRQP